MSEILRRHAFSISFLVILLGFLLLPGEDEGEIARFSGYTMGTTFEVQIVGLEDAEQLGEIRSAVSRLLDRLDRETFSTYAENSELSRFNRHPPNSPFPASEDLLTVLEMAADVSRLSGGAFDVTVGPLVNLWGFGPDRGRQQEAVPEARDIEQAMGAVGFQFLRIDRASQQLSKLRPVYVDLSAIAKGYAVDELAAYLDSLGLESYFVEIGGELKMRGLKPGELSWVPAIEAPTDSESRVYDLFFSHGAPIAVAGSGDYRNYFEEDGQRYSHELDPRTGRPISHNLAAAYVIDESATRADALATAFMVLGLESAQALAERLDQAVYLIYKAEAADFDDYVSPAFAYYLSE